jgi:hypothetical protein
LEGFPPLVETRGKENRVPAHSPHLISFTSQTAHETAMNSAIIKSASISRRALVAGAGVLSISIDNADDAPPQAAPVDARQAPASESWISGLALQAATYAVPIVAMYNLRDSTSVGPRAKVPPNEIWRIENIASPVIAEQAGYVTPNVNVIYGFGFMDLGQQPIILSAPDSQGRYYMVEICDMWTVYHQRL